MQTPRERLHKLLEACRRRIEIVKQIKQRMVEQDFKSRRKLVLPAQNVLQRFAASCEDGGSLTCKQAGLEEEEEDEHLPATCSSCERKEGHEERLLLLEAAVNTSPPCLCQLRFNVNYFDTSAMSIQSVSCSCRPHFFFFSALAPSRRAFTLEMETGLPLPSTSIQSSDRSTACFTQSTLTTSPLPLPSSNFDPSAASTW
eukprot:763615-Hanusia_phi.AAC.7